MAQKKKQVYKSYQPGLFLYTPTYDQLFEKGSVERVIVNFVDSLDMRPYEEKYQGGGTSSYHPSVLLKIILISYTRNEFGCRRIERLARHDMCCQYICNGQTPSYPTINRFRSNILGEEGVEEIFRLLLHRLTQEGLISFEECFTDGTTLEARASRKKIVWQQTERRFAEMNKKHIEEIVEQALRQQKLDTEEEEKGQESNNTETAVRCGNESCASKENQGSGLNSDSSAKGVNNGTNPEGPEKGRQTDSDTCNETNKKPKRGFDSHISLERLEEIAGMIEKGDLKLSASKEKELYDTIEKALQHRTNDLLCGERSGTATTDTDTVAMHPKDDTRKTGPCLPMYNLMVTTENQFFTAYGLFGRTTDVSAFPDYLKTLPDTFKGCTMVADAGFGSYENYELADSYGLTAVFKYSSYDRESKPSFSADPYDAAYMQTDLDGNLICPGGRMIRTGSSQTVRNGITTTRVSFKGEKCPDCPFREKCIKNKRDTYRKCEVNLDWKDKVKPRVKQLLDNNAELLSQRSRDVEPKFSHLRYDNLYRRLRHFGRSRCRMDVGIMLIALNLKKYATLAKKYLEIGITTPSNKSCSGFITAYLTLKLYFYDKIRKNKFLYNIGSEVLIHFQRPLQRASLIA